MYCIQCGNKLEENQKFCTKCGAKSNIGTVNESNLNNNIKNENNEIINDKNIVKKLMLFFGLVIFTVVFLIVTNSKPIQTVSDKNMSEKLNSSSDDKALEVSKDSDNQNSSSTSELSLNMAKAISEIQLDASQIKNLEKKTDWNGGPLYTFIYKQNRFYIYVNQDNTISSIRIGLIGGVAIYEEGYTPLNANDYIVDDSIATQLSVKIQPYVKTYLNYPETAKFPLLDGWGYSRVKDIYGVGGYVKAKNAFGVEDKVRFYGQFRVKNDKCEMVYLTVNGEIKFGSDKQLVEEKVELPINTTAEDGTIALTDGLKGEYGKLVKISGEEYYKYHVPLGKYKIIPKTKNALVFLDDVKTTQNYEGYEESINYKTYRLEDNPDDNIIEVKKNTCIALGSGTKIELIPIE